MNNQWLKLTSVMIFVVLGNIVQTTKVQSYSDILSNNVVQENNNSLIAQSRRTYKCYKDNGVLSSGKAELSPSISGAIIRGSSCYIPISAGQCVAFHNGINANVGNSPSPFTKCSSGWPPVVSDPVTEERYYSLDGSLSQQIILE